jgi:hypothetical protein
VVKVKNEDDSEGAEPVKPETDQEGLPPAAPVATEEIIRERDEQKELALGRLKEIDELRSDRARLRNDIDGLKAKVSHVAPFTDIFKSDLELAFEYTR